MQYAVLIYDEPAVWERMSEEERNAVMGEYFGYSESLRSAGVYVDGNPLESASAATTVRVRDGQRLTTDGPFAETREVLGGYYILECDSSDDALAHAARCPSARFGSIEVRPVMQIPATA